MTEWRCPACGFTRTSSKDLARMSHATCPRSPDLPVVMIGGGRRNYEVYCGNFDCPSRLALKLWPVRDGVDLIDGELWLCPDCRPVLVDVGTDLL